jgi:hypothetical protein
MLSLSLSLLQHRHHSYMMYTSERCWLLNIVPMVMVGGWLVDDPLFSTFSLFLLLHTLEEKTHTVHTWDALSAARWASKSCHTTTASHKQRRFIVSLFSLLIFFQSNTTNVYTVYTYTASSHCLQTCLSDVYIHCAYIASKVVRKKKELFFLTGAFQNNLLMSIFYLTLFFIFSLNNVM